MRPMMWSGYSFTSLVLALLSRQRRSSGCDLLKLLIVKCLLLLLLPGHHESISNVFFVPQRWQYPSQFGNFCPVCHFVNNPWGHLPKAFGLTFDFCSSRS